MNLLLKGPSKKDFLSKFPTPPFGGVFFKTLIGLMLISVVPIACIAAMFYGQSMEFWKGENYKNNQQTLDAAVSIVDSRITMIEWDCALLADDPLVLTFMTNPTFNEVRRNRFITENLISMTEGYNKASLAYVYSRFSGIVLTSEEKGYTYQDFYDKLGLLAYSQGQWSEPPVVRSITMPGQPRTKYMTLMRNVPKNSQGYLGGVVFNVELTKLFAGVNADPNMLLSVYGADRELLYSDRGFDFIGGRPEFLKALDQQSGTFIHSDSGGDYVVLHALSPSTGWTYVGSVPLPQFYKESENISRNILILSGIMLLVCLVISYFMAGKLYNPLKKLMVGIVPEPGGRAYTTHNEYELIANAYQDMAQENSSMSEVLSSMRPAVKTNLFRSILIGDEISPEELGQKLDFIGQGFTPFGYGVLIVHINNFDNYDEESRNLYSFQLIMTLGRAAAPYPNAIIKTDRCQWTLILNTREPDTDAMLVVASEVWSEIVSDRPFAVTIGVGGSYPHTLDLAQSYKEAQEILRFKLYKGVVSGFDIPADGREGASSCFLNTKLEDAVIASVRTGDIAALQKSCDEFFDHLFYSHRLNYRDIFILCSQLVDSLVETLISLGIDLKRIFNKQEFDHHFASAITLEEVRGLIEGLCLDATRQVEAHNNEHGSQNILRMKEFINKNMRRDISLTDLAEHLGLSPAYVSRLFKESLGMGFVEYLNTNRIKRAKILLEETQIMVDQIGFEVGFNNVRSFMRTFKQYEGISPGSYRIMHRQKATEKLIEKAEK